MRAKAIFGTLIIMAVILGVVMWSKKPSPKPIVATIAPSNTAPITISAAPKIIAANKEMAPEDKVKFIAAEKNRLSGWAMNDDSQSLSNILADLYSPEKEIRMAAIAAATQFESTNAIPVLKSVAANTEDTQEAIAMLQAADWLSLPNADISKALHAPTPEQQQAIAQSQQKMAIRKAAQNLEKNTGNPQATQSIDQNASGQAQPQSGN